MNFNAQVQSSKFKVQGSRFVPRTSHFTLRHSEDAIALIIVMIVIFVLTMLAAGFAIAMKVETKLAQNAGNETELQWMGRSGVQYARWVLATEAAFCAQQPDSLNSIWAGGSGGFCATNGPLLDVQKEVHLGHGYFTWKITDTERKWNINTVNESVLNHALVAMGGDASQMTPVVNSILDWVHPMGNPRLQGTEPSFYQNLDHPYDAKNGAMDDISELMLVHGVTPEMYWGNSSPNHPPGYFLQHNAPFGSSGQPPSIEVGLVELFTTLSSGRVNINTASSSVLQLIPGVDPIAADAIVGARGGEDDGTGLTGPYHSVDQVRRVPGVTLELVRLLTPYCDVRSRTFEVEITANAGGSTRTYYALLIRNNPRDVQVVNFYWKY